MIARITENFVPIAANLYKIREAKDDAGDLFRAAQKQTPRQYQGFWIIAPDGQVLASHHDHREGKWTEDVLATIDRALDRAGPLSRREAAPRDVLPDWGKGVQKDGRVTLAVYARFVAEGRGTGTGAIDDITLTPQEWQAFAPPAPTRGRQWALPAQVAVEFRRCLSPVSDSSNIPAAAEVTAAEFAGKVTRIEDGIATLTYTGYITALHTHPNLKKYVHSLKAIMHGTGTYDIDKKAMVSLLWVFEGTSRQIGPSLDTPVPLAAVVEWQHVRRAAR